MEIKDMQEVWSRYDDHIVEHNRLNRDILRRMLIAKPEKRIERYKRSFAFSLIFGLVMTLFFFTKVINYDNYTNAVLFYISGGVIGIFFCVATYANYKYYSLINLLRMSDPVIKIRENLARIQTFIRKFSLLRMCIAPIVCAAILYVSGFKFSTANSAVFLIVIVSLMVVSSISAKKRLSEEFRRFNSELDELENLEKDR